MTYCITIDLYQRTNEHSYPSSSNLHVPVTLNDGSLASKLMASNYCSRMESPGDTSTMKNYEFYFSTTVQIILSRHSIRRKHHDSQASSSKTICHEIQDHQTDVIQKISL